jgi:hypothetical protein
MPYRVPFGGDGRERRSPWRKSASTPQGYSATGLIARLVILPPLLAILASLAWLLWSATEDALGDDSAIFLLPMLAVMAVAVTYHALPTLAGSIALLGWCAFLALVWGVVGIVLWG